MNYYSYNKLLSYNAPLNIIVGARGCGKSFGIKAFLVNQYLKHGYEFMYVRRFENELDRIFKRDKSNPHDFFDDLQKEGLFKDKKLVSKNKKFYCNDVCFGYGVRLTEAQDMKSSTNTNIKYIIFDEYFIEKSRRSYLKDEGMILLGLLDSITRNRNDVKIFIIGNSVERTWIFTSIFIFWFISTL